MGGPEHSARFGRQLFGSLAGPPAPPREEASRRRRGQSGAGGGRHKAKSGLGWDGDAYLEDQILKLAVDLPVFRRIVEVFALEVAEILDIIIYWFTSYNFCISDVELLLIVTTKI